MVKRKVSMELTWESS